MPDFPRLHFGGIRKHGVTYAQEEVQKKGKESVIFFSRLVVYATKAQPISQWKKEKKRKKEVVWMNCSALLYAESEGGGS